ncbi:hypothetical protein NHX12_002499 [Muraenolepis orangiensis]|uniref:Uncharacterized protein n=1 Tax=Muraenolepis orangiensis TaxID=630683 RepID=A0A9Q0DZK9_9TELE|nr:hypothetical protein NHX12_002499 [Muraenolepis orangiensis]
MGSRKEDQLKEREVRAFDAFVNQASVRIRTITRIAGFLDSSAFRHAAGRRLVFTAIVVKLAASWLLTVICTSGVQTTLYTTGTLALKTSFHENNPENDDNNHHMDSEARHKTREKDVLNTANNGPTFLTPGAQTHDVEKRRFEIGSLGPLSCCLPQWPRYVRGEETVIQ